MENTVIDSQMSGPHLQIDSDNARFLGETARWAKFLAIVGFVFCGLIALGAIFSGSSLSSAFNSAGLDGIGSLIGALYLIAAILYFFPVLFLFQFATKMKQALAEQNQTLLTHSFSSLKSCYKYVGILTIIVLCLVILNNIFAGFSYIL